MYNENHKDICIPAIEQPTSPQFNKNKERTDIATLILSRVSVQYPEFTAPKLIHSNRKYVDAFGSITTGVRHAV